MASSVTGMSNLVYLPHLTQARIVRAYRFERTGAEDCWCVLLTDCASPTDVQYAHVMVVHRGPSILAAPPSFAVASEVNKLSAEHGTGSHFLGVFPGQSAKGAMHENLGNSNDWADLDEFDRRALEIIAARLGLVGTLQTMDVPKMLAAAYRLPRTYVLGGPVEPPPAELAPHRWWQFWRK